MSFLHPIHHTFAPMADRGQRMRALRISYAPWAYRRGPAMAALEQSMAMALGGDVITFASGREALLALLLSLHCKEGDEIVVQGYTCVAVPNAIKAAGLRPVYCDITEDTLNLDPAALSHCITKRTRAILCQHTFGIPAKTEKLRMFCDHLQLLLIEDCAHILPDDRGPKSIGAFGDFLLLSFGREKAISGVAGGAIVCRGHAQTARELQDLQKNARDLPWWTVARLLEYPNIYALGKAFYALCIGKAFLWLMGKLHLLVPIYSGEEKHGRMPTTLHRLPNVCAALALEQWKRIRRINDHRRLLTQYYLREARSRAWPILAGISDDLPLQKFPLFVQRAEHIRSALKKKNIHLQDGWAGCVVCPPSIDIADTGYELGKDPHAEAVCKEILSLPTHLTMTMEQAKELVEAVDALLPSA